MRAIETQDVDCVTARESHALPGTVRLFFEGVVEIGNAKINQRDTSLLKLGRRPLVMFYAIAWVTRVVKIVKITLKFWKLRLWSKVIKLVVFLTTTMELLYQTIGASSFEVRANIRPERCVST
jgi:hypothetical protein